MTPRKNQRGNPGATGHADETLSSPEMRDFEERVSAALRNEADEAVARIEAFDAEHASGPRAESEGGEINSDTFTETVRETWQRENGGHKIQRALPAPSPETSTGLVTGRTARLPQSTAKPPGMPMRWLTSPWWAAAAAAVLLAAAVGWFQPSTGEGIASDASAEPSVPQAKYLGSNELAAVGAEGKLQERGESTSPGILPETVDFSEGGTLQGTFRVEIHDVARHKRLDEVPGAIFQTTIYEPRWTCSETERAKLPDVFWMEVYRSVDPPGAQRIFAKLFARQ